MRTAVISDIHGNADALTSVLRRIDTLAPDRIICLGDIVGYGAEPGECVRLLRTNGIASIAGNHDLAVAGTLPYHNFSSSARTAVDWTRDALTDEERTFLASLPMTIAEPTALYVHASPDAPDDFRYLFYDEDAADCYDAFAQPICFVGHTHRQILFGRDGSSHPLQRTGKYIMNVGSVGQPRDGDPRACFVLFNEGNFSADVIRVEYDIQSAGRKIIEAGLPVRLAERLSVGI